MGKGCGLGKVRTTSILKICGDILKQAFLIALGGKVIMSLAIFNQVTGQFALGEQCVAGYNNPFNVEIRQ